MAMLLQCRAGQDVGNTPHHFLAPATLTMPKTCPTGTSILLPCNFLTWMLQKLVLLSLRAFVHAVPCARTCTSSRKTSLMILQVRPQPPPLPATSINPPLPPGYNPERSLDIYSCQWCLKYLRVPASSPSCWGLWDPDQHLADSA